MLSIIKIKMTAEGWMRRHLALKATETAPPLLQPQTPGLQWRTAIDCPELKSVTFVNGREHW